MITENICRCCLTKEDTNLSSLFENNLSGWLREVTNLEIDPNDGFPSEICKKCSCRLLDSVAFKIMCMNSQIKLKETPKILKDEVILIEDDYDYVKDGKIECKSYDFEDTCGSALTESTISVPFTEESPNTSASSSLRQMQVIEDANKVCNNTINQVEENSSEAMTADRIRCRRLTINLNKSEVDLKVANIKRRNTVYLDSHELISKSNKTDDASKKMKNKEQTDISRKTETENTNKTNSSSRDCLIEKDDSRPKPNNLSYILKEVMGADSLKNTPPNSEYVLNIDNSNDTPILRVELKEKAYALNKSADDDTNTKLPITNSEKNVNHSTIQWNNAEKKTSIKNTKDPPLTKDTEQQAYVNSDSSDDNLLVVASFFPRSSIPNQKKKLKRINAKPEKIEIKKKDKVNEHKSVPSQTKNSAVLDKCKNKSNAKDTIEKNIEIVRSKRLVKQVIRYQSNAILKENRKKNNRRKIECSICLDKFDMLKNLKCHIQMKHPSYFFCLKCFKGFERNYQLKYHKIYKTCSLLHGR